jgi:hypothetical protein
MKESLQKFNHWREEDKKIAASVPRTIEDVMKKKNGKPFHAGDCDADPCSCTGCTDWD